MVRMELGELIGKMRTRVAQCRRLANGTTDARTASILHAMADEGEADIERLLKENSESETGTESPEG
jgi:hypothetical protein